MAFKHRKKTLEPLLNISRNDIQLEKPRSKPSTLLRYTMKRPTEITMDTAMIGKRDLRTISYGMNDNEREFLKSF